MQMQGTISGPLQKQATFLIGQLELQQPIMANFDVGRAAIPPNAPPVRRQCVPSFQRHERARSPIDLG